MKLLGKIVSIVETEVFKRKDGTWGPIYSVRIESGDDEFAARTFHSKEGQARIGMTVGAYGEFRITAEVSEGNRNADGKPYMIERKTIHRFTALTPQGAQKAPQNATDAPQDADSAQVAQSTTKEENVPQNEENGDKMPF